MKLTKGRLAGEKAYPFHLILIFLGGMETSLERSEDPREAVRLER